jgi:hypothetical protein
MLSVIMLNVVMLNGVLRKMFKLQVENFYKIGPL